MSLNMTNIPSPMDVIRATGGSKQLIAQAMMNGTIPGFLATLAFDLINRGENSKAMNVAPQPTVAQQVMGGASLAPVAQPPMAPQAGLGALPAPGMEGVVSPPAPQAPPEGAPMGMAGGGLADLPVPDDMFDEPENGGYGGGGLVAFAGGGSSDPLAWLSAPITSEYGVKRPTGTHQGVDFGVRDALIGAPAPGRARVPPPDSINGNYIILEHPDGTRTSYSHLSSINVRDGQVVNPADVIGVSGNTGRVRGKSGGHHLHFGARDAQGNRMNPSVALRNLAALTRSGEWEGAPPAAAIKDRDIGTAAGRFAAVADPYEALQKMFGPSPEEKEIRNLQLARAKEMYSPEYQKKLREDAIYEALGAFGREYASSGKLAEALGVAASGARVSKRERDAAKGRALDAMAEINGLSRKENLQLFGAATDLAKSGMQQEQFEETKRLQIRQLESEEQRAKLDRDLRLTIAAMRPPSNPTQFEEMMRIQMKGTPEEKAALLEVLKQQQQFRGSSGEADPLLNLDRSGAAAGQQPVTNVGGWND